MGHIAVRTFLEAEGGDPTLELEYWACSYCTGIAVAIRHRPKVYEPREKAEAIVRALETEANRAQAMGKVAPNFPERVATVLAMLDGMD